MYPNILLQSRVSHHAGALRAHGSTIRHNICRVYTMCEKSCPKCGSVAHVTSYVSLILSFESWDIALILASIVGIVGLLESLSTAAIIWFSLLAILPAIAVIQRKEFCELCHIEFIATQIRGSTQLSGQTKK